MTSEGSIVVREANKGDLEELLDLYIEFYNELRTRQGLKLLNRDGYRSEVERSLSRDKVFVAEIKGSGVVGFIRISEREGCYWFEELYVKSEYRGLGIGKRLVRVAENYVRERNPYAYVMVLPQDRRAVGFWLHIGYRILNTIELARNLVEGDEETRPIPLLGNILEVYRWAKEDYTSLERRFLYLVEEFLKREKNGNELLKVFVEALESQLGS